MVSPRQHPLAHHVQRPLGRPHRAHGVMDPTAAQAGLGDLETGALGAQQVLGRHPHIVEPQMGMIALPQRLGAQAHIVHHLEALGVRRHQDHRRAPVHRHVGVGDHHHDQERRVAEVGGEPLLAGDHPLVAVSHGPAREVVGIGSALGLGHRVGGRDLPGQQGTQVPLPLLAGAVVGQISALPRVGGLAAEHDLGPQRAPQNLVHEGQPHLPVSGPAQLRPEVTSPQAPVLHLALQGADQRVGRVVGAVEGADRATEVQVERLDLLGDEPVYPLELGLELGLDGEIDGHAPNGTRPSARN